MSRRSSATLNSLTIRGRWLKGPLSVQVSRKRSARRTRRRIATWHRKRTTQRHQKIKIPRSSWLRVMTRGSHRALSSSTQNSSASKTRLNWPRSASSMSCLLCPRPHSHPKTATTVTQMRDTAVVWQTVIACYARVVASTRVDHSCITLKRCTCRMRKLARHSMGGS